MLSDADTADLVGTKLGNYRLERLLGRGRMGVVYLAQDEALLRPTALKLLSWSIQERLGQDPEAWFLSEARNVARVNHPRVIQVYAVARHGAYCYIAMEYVNGPPADGWIAQSGPFSPQRATEILLQAASALHAAHEAGVIHRDVKPENLLITADGHAKLGDFGMALHAPAERATGVVRVGTPLYTAPEIWRQESASVATDIYALGATYYFLLTGVPPLLGADLNELALAHLSAPVPDPRKLRTAIPAGCHEIIQRCMAKTPAARYASAQEVAWSARGILRNLHTTLPPPPSRPLHRSLEARADRDGGSLLAFYGFSEAPFTNVEPADAPYSGEPFASAERAIELALSGDAAGVMLVGAKQSGRTFVARRIARSHAGGADATFVSLASGLLPRFLHQQVALAMGTTAASDAPGAIEGLLEHVERESTSSCPDHPIAMTPLLVLDDVPSQATWWEDAGTYLRAAAATKAFKLLLISDQLPDATQLDWAHAPVLSVELPALSTAQVLQYLRDWRRARLAPGASEVFLTTDAALLVAHRSEGRLGRLHALVNSLLRVGFRQRVRILSSWHAWTAPLVLDGEPSLQPSLPPATWPTPEVAAILNAGRRAIGAAQCTRYDRMR